MEGRTTTVVRIAPAQQKKTFVWKSFKIWAGVDSNHRRLAPTDLQSVPFSHSGTYPYYLFSCQLSWKFHPHSSRKAGDKICPWRDLNSWPLPYQGSALPLSHKGLSVSGNLHQWASCTCFAVSLQALFSTERKKPVIGIEPTTYGLQNRCSTVELYRQQN